MHKFLENILSFVKCLISICCKELSRNSHDAYSIEHMTYVFSARARHINPRLGEESTRSEHEEHVQHGMNRVLCHVAKGLRGRQVVTEASNGVRASGSAASNILLHNRKKFWIHLTSCHNAFKFFIFSNTKQKSQRTTFFLYFSYLQPKLQASWSRNFHWISLPKSVTQKQC